MAEEPVVIGDPAPRTRKWPIVVGVVVVVLIAAGAGFWVWHEQPSFCAAICHTPMDEYLETYEQEAGTAGVDKWGQRSCQHERDAGLVSHKGPGPRIVWPAAPTLERADVRGHELGHWQLRVPLEERDTEMLTEARGVDADEFCLNESCHNLTRDDLIKATSDMEFNPHQPQHGEIECSECHKAHRASVMYCTQCHSEAEVPEGWLTVAEANKLSTAA